jgi:purine nucleosidase
MMKKLVIDCDPGIDDAQAIIMAHQYPFATIEALTTVCGNVSLDRTTANALRILDLLEVDGLPVFAGAQTALVESGENASYVHGKDGLGGVDLPISKRRIKKEHAVLALIRLGKQNPGSLSLIAIGPLTNLALALRLDPDLPSYYDRLVIMGGAYYGQGNTRNFPAEFNLFADPEAASVVFSGWPKLTMISWEATIAHGLPLDDYKAIMEHRNPRSQFLKNSTKLVLSFIQENFNTQMSFAADPLAMAVMLEPDIVTKSVEKFVQIERFGRTSRGMTVVDWWGASQMAPNVEIVLEVDQGRFFELLQSAFI